ncbi:unnamed protein product, partial [Laminaria digitata]
ESGGGGGEECRLEARLLERYDERIWSMHQEYLESGRHRDGGGAPMVAYNPDGHQPLLMELRKAYGGSTDCGDGGSGGAAAAGAAVTEATKPKTPAGRPWTPWQTSKSGFPSAVDGSGSNSSNGLDPEVPLLVPPPPPPKTTLLFAAPTAADKKTHPSRTEASPFDSVGATQRDTVERDDGQPTRQDCPPPGPTVDTPSEPTERPDRGMEAVYERLAERLRVAVRERRGGGGRARR